MNPCLPEWNIEAVPHQNKPKGFDDELVELLWRNGEVVLHSQTHKKSGYDPNECKQVNKHDQTIRANVIQYDETVSWLNCPVDDSFENSPFLPDKQSGDHKIEFGFDPLDINHIIIPQSHHSGFDPNPMPPPRSHSYVKDGSVMTVGGSSHSGSNQVVNDGDTSRFSAAMMTDYTHKVSPRTRSDTMDRDTFEPANTSSSGGSGSSYARTCDQSTATNSQSHKRKSREGEEPECQSKAGEQGSIGGNKSAQKSGTTRRSRAAQVHNLSERRRRDRINEKMKALQELLPHSTKTDKASMLDEAIEYLKSLQMQLQMMWMGSGMASMMFPGVQHYMSRMGMGMGMQNAMHLARLPLVDPAIPNQPHTSMVNYPNFPDQYPAYMGFHPIHASSQPMNMYLGSHTALQNQQLPPSNGSAPTS